MNLPDGGELVSYYVNDDGFRWYIIHYEPQSRMVANEVHGLLKFEFPHLYFALKIHDDYIANKVALHYFTLWASEKSVGENIGSLYPLAFADVEDDGYVCLGTFISHNSDQEAINKAINRFWSTPFVYLPRRNIVYTRQNRDYILTKDGPVKIEEPSISTDIF